MTLIRLDGGESLTEIEAVQSLSSDNDDEAAGEGDADNDVDNEASIDNSSDNDSDNDSDNNAPESD